MGRLYRSKERQGVVTASLVLFRAWLQRGGSSLGEAVGRVEVEVERRSGRVMVKTALTGQPRQAMCGLGAGPRGVFFQQKRERAIFSEWDRLDPDDFPQTLQLNPISLRASVRGRRGAAPTSAPSASPPQALDATGTRAFRVGLRCAFVPSAVTLPVALSSPRIVCAQAARLPNSAPAHAGTLVNVALRSLVLTKDPCPHASEKCQRSWSCPAQLDTCCPFPWPSAFSCSLFPTWSQLVACIHGPRNTPCLAGA